MLKKSSAKMICHYSRSGHSRRVAQYLGNHMGIAPVEVATRRYTLPLWGVIEAIRDGGKGRAAPLKEAPELPDDGLVVLIGPVWAGGAAGPLNTLTDMLAGGRQEVAVLLTCGVSKEEATPLDKIAARLGRPLKAGMVLANAVQDTSEGHARTRAFAEALGPRVPAE